jgi:hypothetical protein
VDQLSTSHLKCLQGWVRPCRKFWLAAAAAGEWLLHTVLALVALAIVALSLGHRSDGCWRSSSSAFILYSCQVMMCCIACALQLEWHRLRPLAVQRCCHLRY